MSQRRRGQFFGGRALLKASLHELEQATVVNKSGLYAEFKDKEDLFVQSLRYYLENLEKHGLRRRLCHQVIELRHKCAFVWSGIVTERLGAFHKNLVRVGT